MFVPNTGLPFYMENREELCRLLMKESVGAIPVLDEGPLQKRMWYVICSLAVGCGGEIKFQRYDKWRWDHLFENIDAN
jgi:hypothetical protein